jgi:cell division protein FtsQ
MDERIRARRREIREARERRRRRWVASLLAVIALGAGAVAAARSPLFAISEIRLTGVSGERAQELRDYTPLRVGENLLAADLGRVERRLQQVPWVRAVNAVRLPPSTVEVRVEMRQPTAVVRLAGAVWTVDADGVVLGPGAQQGLVVIEAPNSVLPGVGTQASDAAVRNALAVHAALPPRWRDAVDRYDAPSERGLRLHLALNPQDGGLWVRFGSAEEGEAKSRVLEALLAEVDRAPVPVAEIDVRAPGNPVLVPRTAAPP